MEILAIASIVGGMLLIIMINNDCKRWKERIEQHNRTMFRLYRRRWLYEMGYHETALSFNESRNGI